MAHDAAIRKAKKAFEGRCVFTGLLGTDGMHLYSAGKFPALADEPFNIFPGVRRVHSVNGSACFDKRADGSERPVGERIWMLRNLSADEMRQIVNLRLDYLLKVILNTGDMLDDKDFGRPIDEKILRDSNGTGWQAALAGGRDTQDAQISDSDGWQAGSGNNERLVTAPFG